MSNKRDDVINYLINKRLVERLSGHYQSYLKDNRNDFEQELWMIILELPTEKLVTLYENKQLDFYLLSVARNQVTNKKSTYNRKYSSIADVPLDYIIDEEIK